MRSIDTTIGEMWREACRHIEIGESTRTISSILAEKLPLKQVFVRRIEVSRSCVETVAMAFPVHEYFAPDAKTEFSSQELQNVLAWCRDGKAKRLDGSSTAQAWDWFVPPSVEGNVLAGPLGDPCQPAGVLVLLAKAGQTFDGEHLAMAQALLDPFSAALENDHRLREMAAMRAAAEADKQSLLTRLGRKDVGDTVVGVESGLRSVIDRVQLVARSDVPVLILGETGTGKEVIARLIHTRSPRSQGPFLRVNCGAIPPELIDSQLFGHEKGAFTGAVDRREGWFERADGGTLLLDEIGELPLPAQVRLLRILQDGWLERVGGHEQIHVDVRIIAATHRNLATMAAEGKFREDLWYRIAVFPILLPPLRERPEDIAELAKHFARKAAIRFVLPEVAPTQEDIALLRSYPWPGNIRELSSVIDRAAILGNGVRLEVAKAIGIATDRPTSPPTVSTPVATLPPTPSSSNEVASLDDAIRQHIEKALAVTHGQIEGRRGAAAVLKINPHTLRAKMRKLGIDWNRFRQRDDL